MASPCGPNPSSGPGVLVVDLDGALGGPVDVANKRVDADHSGLKGVKGCSASLAPVAGKHDVVNEASWESLAKEIEALRKENAALRSRVQPECLGPDQDVCLGLGVESGEVCLASGSRGRRGRGGRNGFAGNGSVRPKQPACSVDGEEGKLPPKAGGTATGDIQEELAMGCNGLGTNKHNSGQPSLLRKTSVSEAEKSLTSSKIGSPSHALPVTGDSAGPAVAQANNGSGQSSGQLSLGDAGNDLATFTPGTGSNGRPNGDRPSGKGPLFLQSSSWYLED